MKLENEKDITLMKKERINYIDWLRVFSAFAVVGIHITMTLPNNYSISEIGTGNYTIMTVIFSIVQWAVPCFLMISGYLLLYFSNIDIKKIKKMILRMILVLFLFGSVYAFMEQIFEMKKFEFAMIPKSILMTLEQKSWSHLWYLYVLIGIYFILIPLKKFIDYASNREVLAVLKILIVGNLIIPTINIICNIEIETCMIFTLYVFYFILGYYIGSRSFENQICIRGKKISSKWIYINTWFLASCAKIMIQIFSMLKTGHGSNLVLEDRIFTLLQAVSVYMLFKLCMNFKLPNVIKSISKCSFGIYLIHPFYINLVYKLIKITPISFGELSINIAIPILWFGVFGLSWISAKILLVIPGLKRIL